MSIKKNFSVGFFATIWSSALGFAMVPLYLKYLGIESYALIGFFTTTLALLSLLDMGLSPTINREVARFSALGSVNKAAKLLHTLSIVYWVMAVFIIGLIAALAPFISGNWLNSKTFTTETITQVIILMGFVAASRWPVGLYQGALMGAQRQAVSSGINIVMSTVGSLGAFLVLAFVSPTIEAFFILQACVGVLYALLMRTAAWRVVGRIQSMKFDFDELKRIWRFSASMGLIGITGLILTQLDKVILSKMLGLVDFGYYVLATVVVSSLAVLVVPFYNVIYPRFTALVATSDVIKLAEIYHLSTRLLVTFLFPITMLLVLYPESIVLTWTGDVDIATNAAPLISLLAIGSALHGVMYIPYALQLAYGLARLTLTISTILVIILLPLIIILVMKYNATGGAMAWLVLHVLYILLGPWLTHRKVLKGEGSKWLFLDVGIPLLITITIGTFGYYITKWTDCQIYTKLLIGFISALIAICISLLQTPMFRSIILSKLGIRRRAFD